MVRIALANIRFPASPDESVALAEKAVVEASDLGAGLVCFPECFVPGYRGLGKVVPAPDPSFLERAWSAVRIAARKASLGVILGTERVVEGALFATALVINPDGTTAGFQDKVQLDPTEEPNIHTWFWPTGFPDRVSDIWDCDLPRRLAPSGNRQLCQCGFADDFGGGQT